MINPFRRDKYVPINNVRTSQYHRNPTNPILRTELGDEIFHPRDTHELKSLIGDVKKVHEYHYENILRSGNADDQMLNDMRDKLIHLGYDATDSRIAKIGTMVSDVSLDLSGLDTPTIEQ